MSENVLCPREEELLDALGRGFVGEELGTHIRECSACTEFETVAGALLHDRSEAFGKAPVPSSGTMLWRMKLRQRHDAEAQARRSLLIGQAYSLALALALLFAIFGDEIRVGIQDLIATIRLSTPLLLALGTWIVLAPIAGYFALSKK